MARGRIIALVAVLAIGAGCEGQNRAEDRGGDGEAAAPSAAGKAEEGRVTIKGPGVDIAVSIPETIRSRAEVDSGNGMIPPDAALSGLHIQGGDAQAQDGSVELRFTSDRSPSDLAAWYRDSARADRFSLESTRQEGADQVLTGTVRESGGRFTVRLTPRGSGTDGRLALADSR